MFRGKGLLIVFMLELRNIIKKEMTIMCQRVKDKVTIIAGGTSGIGKAMVYLFAKEGAKVVFAGRRAELGEQIEKELKEQGYEAMFVQTDITVAEDLDNLVKQTVDKYGRIDILCNNAGKSVPFKLHEMDVEKHYDEVFDLNIKSYFVLTSKVLPYMLKAKKGSIVNTASLAGIEGLNEYSSYCATKGAVIQFTKAGAVEYGGRNIRFNAIVPGLTNTELIPPGCDFEKLVLPAIPMGRAAKPEEVAHAALFLASDDASFCNGTCLVVDGGQSSM